MLNRHIPRLWERVPYKLYLIRQPDRNNVWTFHEKSVVETLAVSEAIPITIKCNTGNHDELKVFGRKDWTCGVRLKHAVAMTHQFGFYASDPPRYEFQPLGIYDRCADLLT